MPTPIIFTDDWTGSDGAAWNSTRWPTVRDVRSPLSTMPIIDGNLGVMTSGPGDCRVVAFTPDEMANFDLTVTLRATNVETAPVIAEIGYRIGANVTSGPPNLGYVVQIQPTFENVWIYTVNASDVVTAVHSVTTIHDEDAHKWRLRVKNNNHKVKWWNAADPEPPVWNIDINDATYTTGRMFLGLYNFEEPDEATIEWDDLTINELLPPNPGLRLGGDALVAAYVGAQPLAASYIGATEIPVP